MLVMTDRNFYSYALWGEFLATGGRPAVEDAFRVGMPVLEWLRTAHPPRLPIILGKSR
jgi:hypothetical protein